MLVPRHTSWHSTFTCDGWQELHVTIRTLALQSTEVGEAAALRHVVIAGTGRPAYRVQVGCDCMRYSLMNVGLFVFPRKRCQKVVVATVSQDLTGLSGASMQLTVARQKNKRNGVATFVKLREAVAIMSLTSNV